jgi:hypothetical protein
VLAEPVERPGQSKVVDANPDPDKVVTTQVIHIPLIVVDVLLGLMVRGCDG